MTNLEKLKKELIKEREKVEKSVELAIHIGENEGGWETYRSVQGEIRGLSFAIGLIEGFQLHKEVSNGDN